MRCYALQWRWGEKLWSSQSVSRAACMHALVACLICEQERYIICSVAWVSGKMLSVQPLHVFCATDMCWCSQSISRWHSLRACPHLPFALCFPGTGLCFKALFFPSWRFPRENLLFKAEVKQMATGVSICSDSGNVMVDLGYCLFVLFSSCFLWCF